MASPKFGLGNGLDSIFADTGSGLLSQDKETQLTIPLHEIEPDKEQPRKVFKEKPIQELADSIQEVGVMSAISVRTNPTGGYIIISGERRWRAARLAGLREIPAVIWDVSAEDARVMSLVENLQREDLDPVEEALAIQQLMEDHHLTQDQVAKRLSKKRSSIANSLRLLNLPESLLELLKKGDLSVGHAKELLSLETEPLQVEAAQQIMRDQLSVRETERLVKALKKKPASSKPKAARPSFAAETELGLRKLLGTEVKIEYSGGSGRLIVGFSSDDQLKVFARLLGEYNPEK